MSSVIWRPREEYTGILCCRKKKKTKGLRALAEVSLRFAQAHTILSKTEDKLEKEIERDERTAPKSIVGRVRHKGGKLLHTKQVLLSVVLLNILDCILVLGELILDIYFMKGVLENSERLSSRFVVDMRARYPQELGSLLDTDIAILYSDLLQANIEWTNYPEFKPPSNTSGNVFTRVRKRSASNVETNSSGLLGKNGSDLHVGLHDDDDGPGHAIEEDIAHAFHKASITILAILTLETLFKVFCFGKELFHEKLECFDGIIVIVSFVVDLVFLKGLSGMTVGEMVVIIAFLVPWRVIRVVNSLVVAVIDHEHFQMKLLYKQKKQVSGDLKKQRDDNKTLTTSLLTLRRLCSIHGISDQEVNQHLSTVENPVAKRKKPIIKSLMPKKSHVFTLQEPTELNGNSEINGNKPNNP